MARICSLSLAEPQHNRTAEPQYVLLDLPPSHSSLYFAHYLSCRTVKQNQGQAGRLLREAFRNMEVLYQK